MRKERGEKTQQKTAKTTIANEIPALTVEDPEGRPAEQKKPDTTIRISKQKDSESNVDYLIRKIKEKSKTKEDAETYLETLLKNAGAPNSVGKTFSEEEIGQAFFECMTYFDHPPPPEPRRRGTRKRHR